MGVVTAVRYVTRCRGKLKNFATAIVLYVDEFTAPHL